MSDSAKVVYLQYLRDSRRWDGFAFRDDDIVISTPTKCGTTWVQMICAMVILQTPELDRSLDRISPWLDMLTRPLGDVMAELEAQTHRRFIKTHTPLDGLPWDDRVTYIGVGRDPRDVAMSWDNHRVNMDIERTKELRESVVAGTDPGAGDGAGPAVAAPAADTEYDRFWQWMDDDRPVTEAACTLAVTVHHLDTFWQLRDRPNVILMHYADLKADLEGEMRRLATRLGITIDPRRWPALVDAATMSRMRERADRLAPSVTESIWHDPAEFFHRGTSGQWRDLLDASDLARYDARLAELATPDLVSWLHHVDSASDWP